MRIAVIHSFYSTKNPSGENTVVAEQVDALRTAGHDVLLVARRTDDEETKPAYAVRSAIAAATGIGPSPDRELQRFCPDVVHVHNTFPNLGTRWLTAWAEKTVVTLHNYRSVCAAGIMFRDGMECADCLDQPVIPAIRHKCYRGSRMASTPVALGTAPGGGLRNLLHLPKEIVTLNDEMASRFRPLTSTPVTVVPNFVPHQSKHPFRNDSWAYVGRLSAEKGAGELLAAWPAGEHLVIYGDGELGEQLRQTYAHREDFTFRGNVERAELLDELGSFNGLVVPSMCAEGLPTAILEALAFGVPSVVSANVSAGPSLELAGVATRVSTTASGLSNVAEALASIQAGGPAMRQRALEVHQRWYSPEAWLANISEVYERIAA